MSEVIVEGEVPAGADAVWRLVTDFVGFIAIQGLPVEGEGEGVGMIRTITFGDAEIVERLESVDEATRSTSYSIMSGPLPVRDYLSTIRIEPAASDSTRVVWSSTFEPDGVPEADAAGIIENVYRGGIAAMTKYFLD